MYDRDAVCRLAVVPNCLLDTHCKVKEVCWDLIFWIHAVRLFKATGITQHSVLAVPEGP